MAVVNKIKQLDEIKIPALVLMAKADGCDTELKIAKWIIAASPYWRSQGYNEIIKEIRNGKTNSKD